MDDNWGSHSRTPPNWLGYSQVLHHDTCVYTVGQPVDSITYNSYIPGCRCVAKHGEAQPCTNHGPSSYTWHDPDSVRCHHSPPIFVCVGRAKFLPGRCGGDSWWFKHSFADPLPNIFRNPQVILLSVCEDGTCRPLLCDEDLKDRVAAGTVRWVSLILMLLSTGWKTYRSYGKNLSFCQSVTIFIRDSWPPWYISIQDRIGSNFQLIGSPWGPWYHTRLTNRFLHKDCPFSDSPKSPGGWL